MTTKLEELDQVLAALQVKGIVPDVQVVYNIGGSATTPPDVPEEPGTTIPVRTVAFEQTPNSLVPTYDLPDANSTKCLLWWKNLMTESVPPAGHKGMPKEADLVEREAHAYRIFKEWAWLPRQLANRSNGNKYSFPDKGTASGVDLSQYPGMWVRRESMTTATSDAWIQSLVEYLKTQW